MSYLVWSWLAGSDSHNINSEITCLILPTAWSFAPSSNVFSNTILINKKNRYHRILCPFQLSVWFSTASFSNNTSSKQSINFSYPSLSVPYSVASNPEQVRLNYRIPQKGRYLYWIASIWHAFFSVWVVLHPAARAISVHIYLRARKRNNQHYFGLCNIKSVVSSSRTFIRFLLPAMSSLQSQGNFHSCLLFYVVTDLLTFCNQTLLEHQQNLCKRLFREGSCEDEENPQIQSAN